MFLPRSWGGSVGRQRPGFHNLLWPAPGRPRRPATVPGVTSAALVLALFSGVALAGPNAGGTILAVNPVLAYTVDNSSYCGLGTAPTGCEGANVELDGSDAGHL